MNINYHDIVKTFRNNNQLNINLILNENDLLKKVILCKYFLSSQKWSILLEKYIKNLFNLKNPINNTSGDAYILDKNIEIKISLNNNKFNFVQIRPDHNIHYYLFLVYNLYENEYGKIYWFLIPSNDLYELVINYCSYSHSTIKKLGKITKDNIFNKNHEYSLRFNIKHKLWDIFKSKYNKNIQEINQIFLNIN